MSARVGTFAPERNALLEHGKALLGRREASDQARYPAAALSPPAYQLSGEVCWLPGISTRAVEMLAIDTPEVVLSSQSA